MDRSPGPPGFHRAELPGGSILAIQQRRELVPGSPTTGVEATITVDDIDACLERATAAGGEVVMRPTLIKDVGMVAFIADPGGNPIGFMQHL